MSVPHKFNLFQINHSYLSVISHIIQDFFSQVQWVHRNRMPSANKVKDCNSDTCDQIVYISKLSRWPRTVPWETPRVNPLMIWSPIWTTLCFLFKKLSWEPISTEWDNLNQRIIIHRNGIQSSFANSFIK